MRALGTTLGVLVLACMPLASACYAPRIDACRTPLGDFSGISSPRISRVEQPHAIEAATSSVTVIVDADTTLPSSETCVAVHAELRDAEGGLMEVLDSPIHASIDGRLLETQFYFYRTTHLTPMSVHVSMLGATLEAEVADSFRPDAAPTAVDAGPDAAR